MKTATFWVIIIVALGFSTILWLSWWSNQNLRRFTVKRKGGLPVMLDAHLVKELPDFTIDVAIKAAKGEVSVLFGPSGSGKTTCLDMIAGLAHPD